MEAMLRGPDREGLRSTEVRSQGSTQKDEATQRPRASFPRRVGRRLETWSQRPPMSFWLRT